MTGTSTPVTDGASAANPRIGQRIGPRPLPVHAGAALSGGLAALAALPLAHSGEFAWSNNVAAEAAALQPKLPVPCVLVFINIPSMEKEGRHCSLT